MSRWSFLLSALVAFGPVASARAQSSQFGVRGLGLPVRPLSPRAVGTGGAFGMFDSESSVNPAAIGSVLQFTSLLTIVQSFRSSTNPFGSASGRDARFPQAIVLAPIGGTPIAASISVSGYTDRSFLLATRDTVTIRGDRVAVFDTLSSTGGLTDLRVAVAWIVNRNLHLGLGTHVIPGGNRVFARRVFEDPTYGGATERAELSYLGFGVSGGVNYQVSPKLRLAGTFRTDTKVTVERDSTKIAETDLPVSFGGGAQWRPSSRVGVAVSYLRRNWSAADSDLRSQGGLGASDAYEVSGGIELLRDVRNPGHRPWRFGVHYLTLPFPVVSQKPAHEVGISLGSGLRFTQGRGGLDLAIQQLWRTNGEGFTERATVFTLGVNVRP